MTDSSRQEQSVEGFIPRKDFEQALNDLKEKTKNVVNDSSSVAELERAYNRLLQLRENAYPLLLLDGNPLPLSSEPINIRLLPPITGLNQRWLVAYFPASRLAPQGSVQLLEWRQGDTDSTICTVNGQAPQPIEAGNENQSIELDERPLEVDMKMMGSSVFIKLAFLHGEITITADTRRGIRSVDWMDVDNEPLYAERYSCGDMEPAVWIRRPNTQQDGHWADDEILDKNINPLAIPDSIGHINGVDGWLDGSGKVFLASDNASVYCIAPDSNPIPCPIPTGAVRDVLAIQGKESETSDEKRDPGLLAAAEDGTIYSLRLEVSENPENQTTLKFVYWQYIQRQIHKIIGSGDRHVLALDRRGTLLPLSLTRPSDYCTIKNAATEALLKHLPPISKTFLQEESYALDMHRGMEHLFWCLKRDQPFPESSVLTVIPSWYEPGKSDVDLAARLHEKLLQRFFEWLSIQCFDRDNQSPMTPERFSVFWPLLDLPDNAPPSLWLRLLQEHDWLDLYAKYKESIKNNKFNEWRLRLVSKRDELANRFRFALHPSGSGRFKERIRHLRPLDAKQQLLVMVDSKRDIRVVRCDIENGAWKILPLKAPGTKEKSCKGMITTLCVLPTDANIQLSQGCTYHVLLGSNRGELRLWGLNIVNDEVDLTLIVQKDLPLSLLCSHYLPERHGVLFGGGNPEDKGTLYWLSLAKPAESQQIWKTVTTGCIGMMAMSGDGKRLWALNHSPGQLLYFPDVQRLFERHKNAGYQEWLAARRPLHALEFSESTNTVVCGGDEGLTLAYDSNTGRLKWAAHCGSSVRHISYLPDRVKEKGIWVLSGDCKESLLLNNGCSVLGVLEHDSPVSTLRLEQETGQLLLGTLNGQILRFTGQAQADDKQNTENYLPPDRKTLLQILHAGIQSRRADQYLEAQNLLTNAADLLLDLPGDTQLAEAIADYLDIASVGSDAVFFHRLLSGNIGIHGGDTSNCQVIVDLCRRSWKGYFAAPSNKRQGAICKTLSGIMAVLESLAESSGSLKIVEPLQDSPWALLKEIADCVWEPNLQNPDNSAYPGFSEETLQAVQLSQLLRHWDATEESNHTSIRLHEWCRRLARYWGLSDWERFCSRLSQAYAANLTLSGYRKEAWEIWFIALLQEKTYSHSAPSPLTLLEQPSDKPLATNQLTALSALFPGNNPWHSWLTNLQHALRLVQDESINASGIAWQQQATWLALREHWQGQGNDYFTLAYDQGLLALWWPHLCAIWLDYIDSRLDAFRAGVKAHAEDYLTVSWSDCWHSAEEVELEIELRNLYLSPLKLVGYRWNNKLLEVEELLLPIDKATHPLNLKLRCNKPEQLLGHLTMRCVHMETGDEFIRSVEINAKRSLEGFAPGVIWQTTWQRLIELLKGGQAFLWVDGVHWNADERKRLRQMIMDKHGLDLTQANESCRVVSSLEQAVNDELAAWPIFSPDLALGAEDNDLIESMQALLCPNTDTFSLVALAVWHAFRPMPEAVAVALGEHLLTPVAIESLLSRLLAGDTARVGQFAKILRKLPSQALGAWCRGEPVYLDDDGQNQELYFPPACAFPALLWDCLDKADVPVDQIAELLNNRDNALAALQQFQRNTVNKYWDSLEQQGDIHDAEALAEIVLSRLAPEKLQNADPVGWFVEDTGEMPRIQLRFEDFRRCYVLPRTTAQIRGALKISNPDALWLCLAEDKPPKGLPGLALALNKDNCLALLHMEITEDNNDAVLRLLNHIAYRQLPPCSEEFWRTAGGLGEQVGKHFAGRKYELDQLHACLRAADHEKSAAVLIVGSRRIGKTTLRQRIKWEIEENERKGQNNKKRLILELDFQDLSQDLRGIELDFEFFKRWAEQLAKYEPPLSPQEAWPSAYKTNGEWRDKARTVIKTRLNAIRRRTGYAPLLSLDETDHLARADFANPKHPHDLFDFLRQLSTQGVCLLATSYPHGSGRNFALNVAMHNATSPLFNTFKELTLGSLEQEVAWLYLRRKLAGMGMILPEHCRRPMLRLSQGIPWIVQILGKELYEATHGNVIRADHWAVAYRKVMHEISSMLRTSVESAAQTNDAKCGVSLAQSPEHCLGNSRLWTALLKLIRSKNPEIEPTEHWPDEMQFDLNELHEYLPQVTFEHLKETLNDLAPSPVVDGLLDGEPNRFKFTNNLLPAWVILQGEQA